MLKSVLLATSMLIAAPALAQDKPATETTQPQPQTPPASSPAQPPVTTDDAAPGTQGSGTVEEAPAAAPAPATEAAQPTPSAPAPAEPAPPTAPEAAPAGTSSAGTTAAAPAPATQPATTPAQVAEAVGRDFGTYDKDANGSLTQAEFGAWVGTLRKASEPAFAPGSPEANVWLGQAFAQADTDKSKSVSKAEVTTFLTPKP